VILIGTGSEAHIAVEAHELLAKEGIATRVVSMPSWELFEAQPAAYRDSVLPPHITARVSIEAGATLGWPRYVGTAGESIGLDRFGASAPYEQIYEHLGLTAERMAEAAKRAIGRAAGGMK
jgi:transketolase